MEASYGKEPFDLRLMCLRLCRNLGKILAAAVVGTLLLGGGYYVKNVLLQPDPGYAASSTYKVEYKENPNAAGAYYINEATWNSFLHTGTFLDGVERHLQEAVDAGENGAAAAFALGREGWSAALSAALPSDFSVPVTKATTADPVTSVALAHAVQATMTGELAEESMEIDRIRVIDSGDTAEKVTTDVRPGRAVILAAVVSLFFAIVFFLLRELAQDSLWLPATLERRYGLKNLGTTESIGFAENLEYVLKQVPVDKTAKIAVCAALPSFNPAEVVKRLEELLPADYVPVPTPLLCPESAEVLREAEAVLLAVPAGEHSGKQLEAVLDYLRTQDCTERIAGAFLWDADEALLRAYYMLPELSLPHGAETADGGERA